jgi:hypothetical protein
MLICIQESFRILDLSLTLEQDGAGQFALSLLQKYYGQNIYKK